MSSIARPGHRLDIARILLLVVFAFIIISNLLYWLPKDIRGHGIDIWVYTDWLIDYSSGFVRRGLSGEIIDLFMPYAHPRMVVGILTWLIYALFLSGYVRLILRSFKKLSLFTLAGLLFLPSLPLFYAYDHDAFGRTESIGYIVLLWHLYLLEKCRALDTRQYIRKLIPVSLIALPIHIFIHESSFLLFAPAHILISYSIIQQNHDITLNKRLSLLFLIYLPVFVSVLCIIIFGRPSLEVAAEICEHWEQAGALKQGSCFITNKNPSWALPGSLAALSWGLSQAISLPMSLSAKTLAMWAFLFLVLGFYTVYIGSRLAKELIQEHDKKSDDIPAALQRISRRLNLKYFLYPLILSSPLYILGWDFGRWFAVISVNYTLIMLSKDIIYSEQKYLFSTGTGKDTHQVVRASQTNKNIIFFINCILLLLIVIFIRLPHCCIDLNIFSESIRGVFE